MRYVKIWRALMLLSLLPLYACGSVPQAVPMAVSCPPPAVVPKALLERQPANGYLLQTTEPSRPEPSTTSRP